MATEFKPSPGWLARDLAKAAHVGRKIRIRDIREALGMLKAEYTSKSAKLTAELESLIRQDQDHG